MMSSVCVVRVHSLLFEGKRDWTDSARSFDWEGADSVSSFLIDSYVEVEIQFGW